MIYCTSTVIIIVLLQSVYFINTFVQYSTEYSTVQYRVQYSTVQYVCTLVPVVVRLE